jgi:hypothetical protein
MVGLMVERDHGWWGRGTVDDGGEGPQMVGMMVERDCRWWG